MNYIVNFKFSMIVMILYFIFLRLYLPVRDPTSDSKTATECHLVPTNLPNQKTTSCLKVILILNHSFSWIVDRKWCSNPFHVSSEILIFVGTRISRWYRESYCNHTWLSKRFRHPMDAWYAKRYPADGYQENKSCRYCKFQNYFHRLFRFIKKYFILDRRMGW